MPPSCPDRRSGAHQLCFRPARPSSEWRENWPSDHGGKQGEKGGEQQGICNHEPARDPLGYTGLQQRTWHGNEKSPANRPCYSLAVFSSSPSPPSPSLLFVSPSPFVRSFQPPRPTVPCFPPCLTHGRPSFVPSATRAVLKGGRRSEVSRVGSPTTRQQPPCYRARGSRVHGQSTLKSLSLLRVVPGAPPLCHAKPPPPLVI